MLTPFDATTDTKPLDYVLSYVLEIISREALESPPNRHAVVVYGAQPLPDVAATDTGVHVLQPLDRATVDSIRNLDILYAPQNDHDPKTPLTRFLEVGAAPPGPDGSRFPFLHEAWKVAREILTTTAAGTKGHGNRHDQYTPPTGRVVRFYTTDMDPRGASLAVQKAYSSKYDALCAEAAALAGTEGVELQAFLLQTETELERPDVARRDSDSSSRGRAFWRMATTDGDGDGDGDVTATTAHPHVHEVDVTSWAVPRDIQRTMKELQRTPLKGSGTSTRAARPTLLVLGTGRSSPEVLHGSLESNSSEVVAFQTRRWILGRAMGPPRKVDVTKPKPEPERGGGGDDDDGVEGHIRAVGYEEVVSRTQYVVHRLRNGVRVEEVVDAERLNLRQVKPNPNPRILPFSNPPIVQSSNPRTLSLSHTLYPDHLPCGPSSCHHTLPSSPRGSPDLNLHTHNNNNNTS